jgi:hypothetical protein
VIPPRVSTPSWELLPIYVIGLCRALYLLRDNRSWLALLCTFIYIHDACYHISWATSDAAILLLACEESLRVAQNQSSWPLAPAYIVSISPKRLSISGVYLHNLEIRILETNLAHCIICV